MSDADHAFSPGRAGARRSTSLAGVRSHRPSAIEVATPSSPGAQSPAPVLLKANLSRNLMYAADILAVFVSLVVSWLHWHWLNGAQAAVAPIPLAEVMLYGRLVPPPWIILPIWTVVFDRAGLYDPHNNISTPKILGRLSWGMMGVVIGVVVADFVLNTGASRMSVALFGIYGLLTSGLLRVAVFQFVQNKPWRGMAPTRVAVLGLGADAANLAAKIQVYRRIGYEFAGFIDDHIHERADVAVTEGGTVLGSVEMIQRIVNEHHIHRVVITDNSFPREDAIEMAMTLHQMGVAVAKVPYLWGSVTSRMGVMRIGDLELIDFKRVAYTRVAERLKRIFDVTLVVLASPLILTVMAAVALAVRLDSKGPIFFIDRRYGKGGRAFNFYKFRSMVVNAQELREKLEAQNESDGLLFKMTRDPRITRVGHFIRKTSLDEFPQFINVMLGDMNLVGPRPLPVRDFVKMESRPEWEYWFEQRCHVKPGLTCLWQVMGRSDLGFDRMVELDIYYIENWSLWMDMQILLKTLPVVLFNKGAH